MSDFSRQVGIISPDLAIFLVTIIGVGHIGSNVARELAGLGCPELTLYDDEKVEAANIPAGFFPREGVLKVEAVREALDISFPDCKIKAVPERFLGQSLLGGVIISGVDTMAARRVVWTSICSNCAFVPLYIDGRTGGEVIEIHTVRPYNNEDVEWYEKTLDREDTELPCGEKIIGYTARIAAGLIASQFKKWLMKQEYFRVIVFNVGNDIFVREGMTNEN